MPPGLCRLCCSVLATLCNDLLLNLRHHWKAGKRGYACSSRVSRQAVTCNSVSAQIEAGK